MNDIKELNKFYATKRTKSSRGGYGYADTPTGSTMVFDPRKINMIDQNPDLSKSSATATQTTPTMASSYGITQRPVATTQPVESGSINRPVVDFGGSNNSYDQLQNQRFSGLQSPSYAGMQEQERQKAQSMIDATEGLYQQNLAAIRQTGAESLAQTSSMQTSAGLAGSPFKQAQENKDIAVTQAKLKAETDRRTSNVAITMDTYDQRAEQKYQTELGNYKTERDAQIAYEAEKTNTNRTILGEYALQGGSLSDFTPMQLDDMKSKTGFDGFQMEVFMNSNKPVAEKPDMKFLPMGNKIVGYYFDEKTGSIKTFESEPLMDEQLQDIEYTTHMTADGTMLLIPKTFAQGVDPKDQIVQYGGEGQFAKKETVDPLDIQKKQLEIAKMQKELDAEPDILAKTKMQADIDKIYADIAKDQMTVNKPPDVKKIHGVDSQWNEQTEEWEPVKYKISKKQMTAQTDLLTSKIDLVDRILENTAGMGTAVGTYKYMPFGDSRWDPLGIYKSDKLTFGGNVNQLIDQETLNTLLELKKAGGTLGAISEKELSILQNAATTLSNYRMKDKNGNFTGEYKVSEEEFKAELGRIKASAERLRNALTQESNKTQTENSLGNLRPLKQGYADTDSLLVDHPEYRDFLIQVAEDAVKSGEDFTEGDLMNLINELPINKGGGQSFTKDPGTSEKGLEIGTLSEKFESGGDPGAIGYDTTGGYSYGTYQLAHNNAEKFINQSSYKDLFTGKDFNSDDWKKTWKELAKDDPDKFKKEQKNFIERTHYDPQLKKLAELGVNTDKLTPAIKDVIWSTAVQHGGNTDVIVKALNKVGKGASEEDIINAIYDERSTRFGSSTEQVRNSVMNRFAQEKKLALNMLA